MDTIPHHDPMGYAPINPLAGLDPRELLKQTPSLPVPRPANDATREKQIPFRSGPPKAKSPKQNPRKAKSQVICWKPLDTAAFSCHS